MALISNIVIDVAAQTAILTATVNGDSVELLTYDNTIQEVIFDARPDIIIQFSDFLSFCDQINIFETAILFNFPSINTFTTILFSQMISDEEHVGGQWNLTVTSGADPLVVEYEGTRSSTKLNMLERSGSKSLSFPEWLYFLQALNHYRLSIKSF